MLFKDRGSKNDEQEAVLEQESVLRLAGQPAARTQPGDHDKREHANDQDSYSHPRLYGLSYHGSPRCLRLQPRRSDQGPGKVVFQQVRSSSTGRAALRA